MNQERRTVIVKTQVTDAAIHQLTGNGIAYLRETDPRSAQAIQERAQRMWEKLIAMQADNSSN